MDNERLVRTLGDEAADVVRAAFGEFEAFGVGDSDAVTVQAALRNDFPIATRYVRSTSAGIATFQLEYEEHDSGGAWQIHTRFVPWRGVMGLVYERVEHSDHKGTAWRIHADSPAIDVDFKSEEEARRFVAPALHRARGSRRAGAPETGS